MTPQELDLAAVWREAEAAGRRAEEPEERGRAIAQQIRCAMRVTSAEDNYGWPARILLEALEAWGSERPAEAAAPAARLDEPSAAAALRMARGLPDEREQLAAVAELLPRLPEPMQVPEAQALLSGGLELLAGWFEAEIVVREAALCLARAGQWRRALAGASALAQERGRSILDVLAPFLPPEALGEALAAAAAMPEAGRGRPRLDGLVAVIPRLPPELLPAALAAARALASPDARVQVRIAALAALPAADQPAVAGEALADARQVPDLGGRAGALGQVLPYLAAPEAQAARSEILDAIRQEERPFARARGLAGALDLVPAAERPAVLAEVLDLARALPLREHAMAYAEILRLLPPLPAAEQEAIAAEAVAAIEAVDDAANQSDAIRVLADSLARLPVAALYRPWCDTLRYLATQPRLLLSLRTLLPVIHALGGATPLRTLAREAERLVEPARASGPRSPAAGEAAPASRLPRTARIHSLAADSREPRAGVVRPLRR